MALRQRYAHSSSTKAGINVEFARFAACARERRPFVDTVILDSEGFHTTQTLDAVGVVDKALHVVEHNPVSLSIMSGLEIARRISLHAGDIYSTMKDLHARRRVFGAVFLDLMSSKLQTSVGKWLVADYVFVTLSARTGMKGVTSMDLIDDAVVQMGQKYVLDHIMFYRSNVSMRMLRFRRRTVPLPEKSFDEYVTPTGMAREVLRNRMLETGTIPTDYDSELRQLTLLAEEKLRTRNRMLSLLRSRQLTPTGANAMSPHLNKEYVEEDYDSFRRKRP